MDTNGRAKHGGRAGLLDGKTLRGSRSKEGTVHLVSAYAAQARLVLAKQSVDGKSNEITAIPLLLDLLDLHGAVVSIDAMGCQKSIAEQLVQGGGDYVLALKDNHPQLGEDVSLWLDTEADKGYVVVHETVEKEHGRIELRRYVLSSGQTTTEHRYYLSTVMDLERFAEVMRGHWAIENCQHWVLDVQFGEDANRARKDFSAENLALVRRMALNIIRHNGPSKDSLRLRKLRASLNNNYRFELIFGKPAT
ncbi:hypothetical protein CCP3SC5AM1_580012 [Gammaproteobacteria bacterium]